MEKILRFGQKGKLSPRVIGSYEILERIGPVAYRLALPPELAKLHDVFMCRCFGDTALINRTYYQCKRYKYKRICLMMRSQRPFYLER